jgi:hypothetical protein
MEISICLTDLGDLTISSNVNIYSNANNYTTPIYTNIPVSSLYGGNCSFTATVPSGTTIIQIFDPITNCTTYINVISSDFCDDCNLRFDVFSSNTVSRIVAGNLIDDCSGTTITDYIVDWYGPNSTTNVAYTSGFGSQFTGYAYTHPLTGSSAIFAQSGSFFPQIRFIKINGIIFSQTGGTGSVLADLNSCLSGLTSTVDVSGFTCTNGVSSVSAYTHEVNFQGVGNVPPPPLQATIILSSTTKYLAWAFNGEEFPDTLRFTFSGSSYSDPIVFEDITTGWSSQLGSGTFNPLIPEKTGRTGSDNFIKKISVLTGLTINNNDKIIIDITPSQLTNETNWSLFFNSCLTTYDCTSCLLDTPIPYKISGSTILVTNATCGTYVNFQVTGCTYEDVVFSDLYQYVGLGNYSFLPPTNTDYILGQGSGFQSPLSYNAHPILIGYGSSTYNTGSIVLFHNNPNCTWTVNQSHPLNCTTTGNNIINYKKTNTGVGGTGIFEITFNNVNDFNFYLNGINDARNRVLTGSTQTNCTGPFSTNPIDCEYYRMFVIKIPYNFVNQTSNCGDNTTSLAYNFHASSVLTTGTTGSLYTIQLTMPTIVNNYPILNCSNCFAFTNTIYSYVNDSSTGTTGSGQIINTQTNNGSKYSNFTDTYIFCCPTFGSQLEYSVISDWALPKYCNETYMYSGSPLTLIPSLSAETCDFTGRAYLSPSDPSYYNPSNNGGSYVNRVMDFKIIATNNNDIPNNFSIQTRTKINGEPTGLYFDIYTVVGGLVTYSDPTYII